MNKIYSMIIGTTLMAGSAMADTTVVWQTTQNQQQQDLSWIIRGRHRSTSDTEKRQLALSRCQSFVENTVMTANQISPNITYSYRGLEIESMWGTWSRTKKDPWTGKRSHEAGGMVRCHYELTITTNLN